MIGYVPGNCRKMGRGGTLATEKLSDGDGGQDAIASFQFAPSMEQLATLSLHPSKTLTMDPSAATSTSPPIPSSATVAGLAAPSAAPAPRKVLHSKRSFGTKHSLAHNRPVLDSPAYDASEEDNDPLTDDAASAISVHVSAPSHARPSTSSSRPGLIPKSIGARPRHALAATVVSSDDGGIDSPTYDGDVESIITTRGGPPGRETPRYASSIASTLTSPFLSSSVLHESDDPLETTSVENQLGAENPLATPSTPQDDPLPSSPLAVSALAHSEPVPAPISVQAFNPANLTPNDIQEFARACIASTDPLGSQRKYRINPPPTDRPVRIYADGVYDLFHFGHALQLRQAKLAFPVREGGLQDRVSGVHLLVGVNSDEQCVEHKNIPIMRHAERCEAVRHCRWVDEVIPDAPWVIDREFIEKYQIDYVAHDEDPYVSNGHDDVYAFVKNQGKFLPTRRTPGVSTSELLERIVSGYRHRIFDKKLARMGHAELMAEGSDYDDSAPPSGRASPSRRQ